MGAFKDLNRSDIFLTEHVASKSWNISESMFRELGISKFYAQSGSIPYYPTDSDLKPIFIGDTGSISGSYYPRLAYQGLDEQFYGATQTGSIAGSFSGSYNISEQSTITIPGSRTLGTQALVYSIPRSVMGSSLQMQSIRIVCGNDTYIDNEGVLINSASGALVGDVIYDKGLLIFTDDTAIGNLGTTLISSDTTLAFTSTKHINTYNIDCKVKGRELNRTYNWTAKDLNDAGIEFTPYITSVGLYNSYNELLAVAKFSRPIQKAANVDTTIKVQLDIS